MNQEYENILVRSGETFNKWRLVPAPERGQLIREVAETLRNHKKDLGALVTKEVGKILAEGEGEIQEAIDIADFAVGLSRQFYGNTMHSERPMHRMYEQWHPLGVVGVITAFNFPAAVWAWNAFLAAACGNTVIWKPSELAPETAREMNRLCSEVATRWGFPNLFSIIFGDRKIGEIMAADKRLPLISATGSCEMGRAVASTVAGRLGRTLLELGGNNAVIVLDDAELSLVVPSTVFGSVGTAGQRCTTTRRLLIQRGIEQELIKRLVAAYKQVRIGDPMDSKTLMGPLINEKAVANYKAAVAQAVKEGGEVLFGGKVLEGLFVEPTIIKMPSQTAIVRKETFAPILYVLSVNDLDHALKLNNEVEQGLSSAIFTTNVKSSERFLSHAGSDCGIANVNLGTSGAEIGGAFGGEKDTGGGREAGSDSWKSYMRRQTNTINFSDQLPLAQGIKFGD